jgi:hypothetical protein
VLADNRYVPFSLTFQHQENESSGLGSDYTRTDDFFLLLASNTVGISRTDFMYRLQFNETDYSGSRNQESDIQEFLLSNRLTWYSAGKRRSLYSSINQRTDDRQLIDESSQDSERLLWYESLEWEFGKALDGTLQYSLQNDDEEFFERTSHVTRATLEHHFVESLVTRFEVENRREDFDENDERSNFGTLFLDYTKKLPRRSLLNLGYLLRYGVTDRDEGISVLPGEDNLTKIEMNSILATDLQYELKQSHVDDDSIEVYAIKAGQPYLVPGGYDIELDGIRTIIIFDYDVFTQLAFFEAGAIPMHIGLDTGMTALPRANGPKPPAVTQAI